MTFCELADEVKKIKRQETRELEENCLEVVVGKSELGSLHAALQAFFGEPLKPEGQSPSGTRFRAMSIKEAAASSPVILAPRLAAKRDAPPPPHPASSNRVPGPTAAAVNIASQSGRCNGS